MSSETLQQRRDGRVLCEVPVAGPRTPRFYEGADASSSAFAFASLAVRARGRDDAAIAAAWTSRVVRRTAGAEAVSAYDETGAWTPAMEETFAYGFVAFLRNAAWGGRWPQAVEPWRAQIASSVAVCHESDGERGASAALDDAARALFARVVAEAAARDALPFAAPATEERPPYGGPRATAATDPAPEAGARVRRASVVVGEEPAPPSPGGPTFAGIDERAPRRFGPSLVALAGLLTVLALGTWALYALVLRPGRADAIAAGAATLEQLETGKYSPMYEEGAARLRATQKWTDFSGRVRELEHLGKLLESSEPTAELARDPELGRTAAVSYDARYTFGTAHLVFRYVDVGFAGEWRLVDVAVEPHPEISDGPYPPTDDGADALARRFVYALQVKDFDWVDRTLGTSPGRDKISEFREGLFGDGYVTLVERLSLENREVGGVPVRLATYRVETSREHRAGTIAFSLAPKDGAWSCLGAETRMNYRY